MIVTRKRFVIFFSIVTFLVFVIGIGLYSGFYFNKSWFEVRNALATYHLTELAEALPIRSIDKIKVNTWKGETTIEISKLDLRLTRLVDRENLEDNMREYRAFVHAMTYPVESLIIAGCDNPVLDVKAKITHITNVNEKLVNIDASDACIGNVKADVYVVNFDDNTLNEVQELLDKGDFKGAFSKIYVKNITLSYTPAVLFENYKKVMKMSQSSITGNYEQNAKDAVNMYMQQMWDKGVVDYTVARNVAKLYDFMLGGGALKFNLFFANPIPMTMIWDYIVSAEIMDKDTLASSQVKN